MTAFAPTIVRRAEDAERHERRGVARLDQHKGGEQGGGAGQQQDRLY
jgi:hypothetical protein